MKSIYVSGMAGSGKTAIALGLALKLRENGLAVGYFKPVGSTIRPGKTDDEDVLLFKQVLNLSYDTDILSPVRISKYYLSGGVRHDPAPLAQKIRDAYNQVAQGIDVLIIDGKLSPFTASSLELDSIHLATMFNSTIIYVIRIEDDYSLDKTIFYNRHFRHAGIGVLGNIFNNVERTILDKTKGVYAPILEEMGNPVLGIIPQKPEIASPTVAEFYDALGGELLAGEEHLARLVEEVVVGSMTIESALGYLRRAPNKAVITGGDRSDMALTALETSTSVLILTGGLYPDVGVLARAIEKKVPVIMVHYDTFTAIERLHIVARRIHPGDKQGIEIAHANITNHCNWQAILDYVRN
ncbi:MAG: phosphotransacetylase family protein [Dethiobacter sp.]|jgi:BioD-like phosphotransacetylase family protein|nr:phosphotransacetylase family protein [Dethiobacter sp.]